MKFILLAIFLSFLALRYFLRFLNLRHLGRYGAVVPPGFDGEIDPQTLGRTAAYTLAQSRASLVESLAGNALLLAFLFGGLLPLYDRWFASLGLGFIPAGILFFLGIFLVQTAIDVPFSLYRNFVIENRFGFNAMGWRIWLGDLLKSTGIALVLFGLLLGGCVGPGTFQPRTVVAVGVGLFRPGHPLSDVSFALSD